MITGIKPLNTARVELPTAAAYSDYALVGKLLSMYVGLCMYVSMCVAILFGQFMEILYGAKNGVYAFGYNSAESEPIWMKSRAL